MLDNRLTFINKLSVYDYETITVANTAIGLTASKLTTARKPISVFITIEDAEIRYRMDGTTPTSTVGHILQPGDSLLVEGWHNMNNIKFIRTTATSGILQVSYRR